MDYHIIGDIHGQADKLVALLERLGYEPTDQGYYHPDARVVFLGDFIDRGPHQKRVLDIVRPMVESGSALAVMGNHEFNAIAYHSRHPETGEPLRPHNEKNTGQHQAFLEEYGLHEEETREVIQWFRKLPLHLEIDDGRGRVLFRVVHACWSQPVIDRVPRYLDDRYLVHATTRGHPAYDDLEVLLKGPEIPLPEGADFHDKDGNLRHHIRIQWWNTSPGISYRELAMVPAGEERKIPDLPVPPESIAGYSYGPTEPPVFFGHYWLTGEPSPIADNLACLDYSAGKEGQLVAYWWREADEGRLSRACFVTA